MRSSSPLPVSRECELAGKVFCHGSRRPPCAPGSRYCITQGKITSKSHIFMCGILGRTGRASTAPNRLDASSDEFIAIGRRGPDSNGFNTFHCHGHVVTLAHSRLSIIDLSEQGHQPMHDSISGWWITYNGEIYNYIEIREELRGLGWSFRSTGDAEVLLKAWAQWGMRAFRRFNGMFAVAAFHPVAGELWLVRDRFGVKPLAWGRMPDGGIAFSSSVAGIAEQMAAGADIDYCGRGLRYKVYETEMSGAPFKGVNTVPAGGWVKIRLSDRATEITDGKWYDLRRAVAQCARQIGQKSDTELVEQCRAVLEDAVRLRLRSDVPVAVSLSGGLDSSTVAALAARDINHLRGFTYGSPHAKASEGPVVLEFAREIGMEVTYVWPQYGSKELGEAMERTLAFQEAPMSGLSQIAQNEVYRSVHRAGYKVLLGGQGGDEIFAGYRKFFFVALREALHRREPGNALRLVWSLGLMLLHEAGQARMYWEHLGRYRSKAEAGFRLLDWQPAAHDLWGVERTLTGRQIDDVQLWSLPTLLRYEDRNSMGYGVESRLPFMDYRLVELALVLPSLLKIRNGYGKWALRAMTTGVVPDSVRLMRKKRGFDVTQAWIRDGIGECLRSMVLDNRCKLVGHLRPGADVDRLMSDASLASDSNLLDEALMLAWLARPAHANVAARPEALAL
jgi:asparagine synthase (glutamine-hydrolysing)